MVAMGGTPAQGLLSVRKAASGCPGSFYSVLSSKAKGKDFVLLAWDSALGC